MALSFPTTLKIVVRVGVESVDLEFLVPFEVAIQRFGRHGQDERVSGPRSKNV